MTSPRTASPRNSNRSFVGSPPFSYANDRWVRARSRMPASSRTPSASSSGWVTGEVSLVTSQPGHRVVGRRAHRLEVFDVVVVDGEAIAGPRAQLVLDDLDDFDERQRVRVQIGRERGGAADRRRIDLEHARD